MKRKYCKYLECAKDNSLVQVMEVSTGMEAIFDFLHTNREDLIEHIKIKSNLDDSNHKMTELR